MIESRTTRRYRKKGGRAKVFLSAAVVIILMIVYVAIQMYILTLEKRIHETRGACSDALETVEELKIKVAELSKAGRIKQIATEKIGLKIPVGAPDALY